MITLRGRAAVAVAMTVVLAACAGGDADSDAADAPATPPDTAQTGAAGQPAPQVGANVELPAGVTQEMVAQGRQLFNQQICWTCHGMDATGGPLAPAMTDQEWLNTDGSFEGIVQVIQVGVPTPKQYSAPMPPMGGAQLSEEQVRQLAAYVYAVSRGG